VKDFPDEVAAGGGAAAAAPSDEDVPAADPIVGPVTCKKIQTAPALVEGLLRYGPHAALTAWMIAAVWTAGSHFVGPARTIEQQESVRSADTGHTAQKMPEDLHAQEADVEAMHTAQIPSTEDATGLGSAKPRLDAAKIDIKGAMPEASGTVEHLQSKPAKKLPKTAARVDRIGLKIAALLATAPVADRSVSAAPVARKRAQGGRGDAFDPSQNPSAPGAPRPLGTIAPTATAKSSLPEYASGQSTN
jgi:hypothetical protein